MMTFEQPTKDTPVGEQSTTMTRRSKLLSLVLRHSPQTIGLELDEAGWAHTDELLACLARSGKAMSPVQLQAVVASCAKQRFAFSEDGKRIRANQGHSVTIELQLVPSTPPDALYHGTATRFLDAILAQGLQRQKRHHVHLSASIETAGAVGRRHGKLALLRVDAAGMVANGHVFYCSDNGVWLTDAVPVTYLQRLDE
jgi:putative RNA 2'-phosphotransferase